MARVPVEMIDLRGDTAKPPILPMLKEVNEIQSEYEFSLLDVTKTTQLSMAVHEDTDGLEFLERMNELKSEWLGYHPFLFCLLDSKLSLDTVTNLFSVDQASSGLALVTTSNVGGTLMPAEKLRSYIIFQMAFFSLKFSGGNLPFHREDRGCFFDYRENKTGIRETIASGRICDMCKRALEKDFKVSPDQLSSIFAISKLASVYMTKPEVEIIRPGKSRIFIGSSVEGLQIAHAIQVELEHDFNVEIWNQSDVFRLGSSTLEALEGAVEQYDFGIFVFNPDDKIEVRHNETAVARDNVIFEFGLFIGKMGRFKSFIVKPRDVAIQIPTDLNGITVADYDSSKPNLNAAVGAACSKLRASISRAQIK